MNDSVFFQYNIDYLATVDLFNQKACSCIRRVTDEQHHYVYTNLPPVRYKINIILKCHNALID